MDGYSPLPATYNPLRTKLENGEAVIGAVAKVPSPALIEVYGEVGLDFVFIDLEHGGRSPFDSEYLEGLWRTAVLGDIEPLVRLPSAYPPLVRKVLDTGIRSILIPRVKTADEVREAVEATQFVYEGAPGERGFVSGCQANRWGRDLDGYLKRQDDTTLVGVIFETAAAVENVDEILAIPELGFAFIGHRDLSISLGHHQMVEDIKKPVDHPKIVKTTEEILNACSDMDVPVGRVAADPMDARNAVRDGFQLFFIGYELHAVREVFGQWVSAFRDEG